MEENFKFKKSLGQNFLTDKNLLKAIVNDAGITPSDNVIEIGAGAGALTEMIASQCKNLYSFEVDRDLFGYLEEKFKGSENVKFVFKDALKMTDEEINKLHGSNFKLVANLPYYITTPLIFKFLNNPCCESLTIMVQKEVADRVVAAAGSKAYGVLSVKVQALANAKITRDVNRKMFTPAPNVDSAVLHISKKEYGFDFNIFSKVVDSAFAMRRKTLVNNLSSSFGLSKPECEHILTSLGYNPSVRGEQLNISQFIQLSEALDKKRQKQ